MLTPLNILSLDQGKGVAPTFDELDSEPDAASSPMPARHARLLAALRLAGEPMRRWAHAIGSALRGGYGKGLRPS